MSTMLEDSLSGKKSIFCVHLSWNFLCIIEDGANN